MKLRFLVHAYRFFAPTCAFVFPVIVFLTEYGDTPYVEMRLSFYWLTLFLILITSLTVGCMLAYQEESSRRKLLNDVLDKFDQ